MLASIGGSVLTGACFNIFRLSTAATIGVGVLGMVTFSVGSVVANMGIQELKRRMELQLAIREQMIKSLERSKGKGRTQSTESKDRLAEKAAVLEASLGTSESMKKLRKRFDKEASAEYIHKLRDMEEGIRLEAHKSFLIKNRGRS